MIKRDFLVEYLNEFLDSEKISDYCLNGLQIEGRDEIFKICTSVSAAEVVIRKAIELEADMLLVHHGYFWKGESPLILGSRKRKFSLLLQNNINLCAYHLPLDNNLELGNNVCLSKILPVNNVRSHEARGIKNILWTGELVKPMHPDELAFFLEKNIQKPICLSSTKNVIHKIAWCSGAAQDYIEDASKHKVDAYISGEVSERTFYQAQELDIHYYACGHHATERYGVQALGEHLSNKFNLKHEFIDIHNPV